MSTNQALSVAGQKSYTSSVNTGYNGSLERDRISCNNLNANGNLVVQGSITGGGSIAPSGQILAIDGTVSAPGYSFQSDQNTGFWKPANNSLGITINGINYIQMDGDEVRLTDNITGGPGMVIGANGHIDEKTITFNNDGTNPEFILFRVNGVLGAEIRKGAAPNNDLFIRSVDGDVSLITNAAGADVILDAVDQVRMTGTTIRIQTSNAAGVQLGFFDKTGVDQHSTTGSIVGFTQGGDVAGDRVQVGSTFSGNGAGKAYTIDDIVLALKNYGLLDSA